MAQELIAVRMMRTIPQFPLVLELLQDQVYWLPALYATRLIESQVCERMPESPTTPRLEAAALAAARRRG